MGYDDSTTSMPDSVRAILNTPQDSLFLPREMVNRYGLKVAYLAAFIHAGDCPERGTGGQFGVKQLANLFRCSDVFCRVYPPAEEIADILRTKKPQETAGQEQYEAVCSWCRARVPWLHSHHFPAPKSKGGTETIGVCPNCHIEYHFLYRVRWGLTPWAQGLLDEARRAGVDDYAARGWSK